MATQASDVIEHLGSTELDGDAINSYITMAEDFYDDQGGTGVGSALYDHVVSLLAAHFIAAGPERQIASGGEGGGNVQFEGETGMGLDLTTHGQQAQAIDPTGNLKRVDVPSISFDSVNLYDDSI